MQEEFVAKRVNELVCTSNKLLVFSADIGYGEIFEWNAHKRDLLQAELDAYYANIYGLTRSELAYILDPASVFGKEFPSETFRVLRERETSQYDEYRTQRLVLEAWDRFTADGTFARLSPTPVLIS